MSQYFPSLKNQISRSEKRLFNKRLVHAVERGLFYEGRFSYLRSNTFDINLFRRYTTYYCVNFKSPFYIKIIDKRGIIHRVHDLWPVGSTARSSSIWGVTLTIISSLYNSIKSSYCQTASKRYMDWDICVCLVWWCHCF